MFSESSYSHQHKHSLGGTTASPMQVLRLALTATFPWLVVAQTATTADALVERGFKASQAGNGEKAGALFHSALELQPNNANALVQLGLLDMSHPDPARQLVAFQRMEAAFSRGAKPIPVPIDSVQGMVIAGLIGRWRAERGDFVTAERFFAKAARSTAIPGGKNYCERLQHATLISSYPESHEDAWRMLSKFHTHVSALLADDELTLSSPDDDPYIFCMMSGFVHSLYLMGSVRDAAKKQFEVARNAFPWLNYVSPTLRSPRAGGDCDGAAATSSGCMHRAVDAFGAVDGMSGSGSRRRIRIGVASAFFEGESSITLDFCGMLNRLPRSEFEVTIIRFVGEVSSKHRNPGVGDTRLYAGLPGDGTITLRKDSGADRADGGGKRDAFPWMKEGRQAIEALDLDLLLYLDLTMSGMAQRLAMSRLARTQATTHGHPVTSGIDRSVMQYYISWGAAEVPGAQEHYTEELVLLPAHSMHQYYEPRAPAELSLIDGSSARSSTRKFQLTRADFIGESARLRAEGQRWYMCMQKPFKRQPAFDTMLAGITKADPQAQLLLHALEPQMEESHRVIVKRLQTAGADMSRVHFLPAQPLHRLLALYALSDVVLDSYPASGCTTTREALEVGALVVTLPSQHLGGRWSMAYYEQLGVTDLVAKDADDYVRIAVRIATDESAREEVKRRVQAALPKLFRRQEAVDEWSKMLRRLALGSASTEPQEVTQHHAPSTSSKRNALPERTDPMDRVLAQRPGTGGGLYL